MAIYNNGYPLTYPYFPQYQQNLQTNLQPNIQNLQPNLQTVASQPQIQNGGFISVRSEEEAKNYPIAYGNSITFKDETAPYVYVKTMGFSQLDRPVFEKFRLVKESDAPESTQSDSETLSDKVTDYVTKSEYEALQESVVAFEARIETLEADIEDLRTKISEFFAKKPEPRKKA